MRRAIRQMIKFPVFALFLSTTGNIHDFTPPPKQDPSKRLSDEELHPFPPFTELGFDQMLKADNLKIHNETLDIDDVSRVGFMSRFGRLLYVNEISAISLPQNNRTLDLDHGTSMAWPPIRVIFLGLLQKS